MQEYDMNCDLDNIFWEYDQERKIASDRERVALQGRAEIVTRKEDENLSQTSSTVAHTGTPFGFGAGYVTDEDDSGNDSLGGSVPKQDVNSHRGFHNTAFFSNGNKDNEAAEAAEASKAPIQASSCLTCFVKYRRVSSLADEGQFFRLGRQRA
jgi:hypothetical protein